jgi:general secretion pathway protein A
MYNDFYGLTDDPFRLTPDPGYFYCSETHEDAIKIIEYGIYNRKGFIMLTGEVGTGKTMLCRVLLDKLVNTETSLVLNPLLTPGEILKSIAEDFGININKNANDGEIYNLLVDYLTKIYKDGKNALIIVDEAQHLPFESLEMIRQISNIEMENAKLVQVLLVGQPELLEKLSKKEYRQLLQRISLKAELHYLNREETFNYINFRLNQASRFNTYLFKKSALNYIYKASGGCPREINNIADSALLIAAANRKKRVTVSDVKKAVKEYKYFKKSKSGSKIFGLLLIILIFVSISGYIYVNYLNKIPEVIPQVVDKEIKISPMKDNITSQVTQDNITETKKNIDNNCLITTKNTKIRFEPLEIDNIIKTIPAGTKCKLLEFHKNWYKVKFNDIIGWIKKENSNVINCGVK